MREPNPSQTDWKQDCCSAVASFGSNCLCAQKKPQQSRIFLHLSCFLPQFKCPSVTLIRLDHKPPGIASGAVCTKYRSRTYFCPQDAADGSCQNLQDTKLFLWNSWFLDEDSAIKTSLFTCSIGEQNWHLTIRRKNGRKVFVDSYFPPQVMFSFFWQRSYPLNELSLDWCLWRQSVDRALKLAESGNLNLLLMYSRAMSLHNWEQLGLHIFVFLLPPGRMC